MFGLLDYMFCIFGLSINIRASHRHSLTTGYLYYFPSEWTQPHFHFKSEIIYNQEEVSEAQGRDGYHNGQFVANT